MQPTNTDYYEAQAYHVGYAATYVAFAAAFLVMLVVDRIASATLVLLARLVWGVNSVPEGCLDEPMRTIAGQLLKSPSATGSNILAYLETLSPPATDSADSSSNSLKGYASMQMFGAFASFLSSVGGSVAGSMVDGLTAISAYLFLMAALTLTFSLLFLVQASLIYPIKPCTAYSNLFTILKTGKLLCVPDRGRGPVEQGLRSSLLQAALRPPADRGRHVLQPGAHLQRIHLDRQAHRQQCLPGRAHGQRGGGCAYDIISLLDLF
jgi:hypothetical protein